MCVGSSVGRRLESVKLFGETSCERNDGPKGQVVPLRLFSSRKSLVRNSECVIVAPRREKALVHGGKNDLGWGDSGGDGHWAIGPGGLGCRRRPVENRVRCQPFSLFLEYFSGSRWHAFAERNSPSRHKARIVSLPPLAERSMDRLRRNHFAGEVNGQGSLRNLTER